MSPPKANSKGEPASREAFKKPSRPQVAPYSSYRPSRGQWLLGGTLLVVLTALLSTTLSLPLQSLELGDIAVRDIKAPADFLVEDKASTMRVRKKAEEGVKAVYDLQSDIDLETLSRVGPAFESIREAFLKAKAEERARRRVASGADSRASVDEDAIEEAVLQSEAFQEKEVEFYKALGIEPDPGEKAFLRAVRYAPWVGDDLRLLVAMAMEGGVVSERKLLERHLSQGIIVRDVKTGEEVKSIDLGKFRDLREIASYLEEQAPGLELKAPPASRQLLIGLAVRLVQPALTFNKKATEQSRKEALERAKPVFFQVKKGEMIIREGERVDETHLAKLEGLKSIEQERRVLQNLLGTALLVGLSLVLGWLALVRYGSSLLWERKSLQLLALVLALNLALVRLSTFIAWGLAESMSWVPLESHLFAIPFAAGPMLVAVLLGRGSAILMALVTAGLVGILMPSGVNYALVALAGGVLVALRWHMYRRRSAILVTGLLLGLLNAAAVGGLFLTQGRLHLPEGFLSVAMGFMGGLTTAAVVSVLLPVLESLFNVTTDIKLMELENHPLLRELAMRAPGTHHHSIIVADLAEEAAEAIGANPLFARVASYFHDIGKMYKTEYFVENQRPGFNKHDKLTPRMSGLVIISHIKDGVELAREHKLPQPIIDIIREHHGTSLIRYFYSKALERKGANDTGVREEDYRYPGPKPQSREAA
ncbi:MAG: HD family phosphohydrolase, partial [Nitrospinota bacterium]